MLSGHRREDHPELRGCPGTPHFFPPPTPPSATRPLPLELGDWGLINATENRRPPLFWWGWGEGKTLDMPSDNRDYGAQSYPAISVEFVRGGGWGPPTGHVAPGIDHATVSDPTIWATSLLSRLHRAPLAWLCPVESHVSA